MSRRSLDEADITTATPPEDLLALDDALTKLADEDPAKAQLVKLHYVAGLSVEDAAKVLDISRATADRHWQYAKVWLYCALHGAEEPPGFSEISPGS